LHQAITLRILDEVFAIAHKMLTDLAGVSLDERMCEVFTHHLQELSGKAKVDLVTALATSADPVLVRSAFALSSAQQSTVHQALQKISSTPMQLQFEMAPDLIGGIEVIANGNKVAWSIADHLTSLEKDINELLEKNEKSEMKVESKAKSKVKPEAKSKAKTPPNPKGKNT
jgi:F-type H+-transporting ATPase subunit b